MANLLKGLFPALFFIILPYKGFAEGAASKLKKFLKDNDKIAVDFIQTDEKGDFAEGKLLVEKPFKFRCEYYPPYPLLIVGRENKISIYDYGMEQITRVKPKDAIFNFLLLNGADLEKNFIVLSERGASGETEITLKHIESDKESKISFDSSGSSLKSLEIFEETGAVKIIFAKIQKVSSFDSDLFTVKNPNVFGSPPRLSKETIEKKYIPE